MSQLVRLEGKHTAQTAHCALLVLTPNDMKEIDLSASQPTCL